MGEKLKQIYRNMTLAVRIRYSYLILLIPIVLFMVFCFLKLLQSYRDYEDIINSSVVASNFSRDFQKDFDYETYLVIVGKKTIADSELETMLAEARGIVAELEALTDTSGNMRRLNSVEKYLDSLENYKERIEKNLQEGNPREDNMQIWESGVQSVTTLIKKNITEYIHYEIQDIQTSYEEYQNMLMRIIRFSGVTFISILFLIVVLSYYISTSITQPIRQLGKVTDQVAKGDLTVRSDVRSGAEVSKLTDSFNTMIDKVNELLEQVTVEQDRLQKARMELLQAQINPHFLYNTLDAIVWLAEAGEQKRVVSMVGSLSDFFRTSLSRGKDIISIKEEITHVRSYLEIQQVRYQDILNYEILIPEEFYNFMIPKITVQPLVENALYHGIKNKRGLGLIQITGEKTGDFFVINIKDNGIGITEERLVQVREGIENKVLTGKDMYGLYNVNERIRLNFGEKYGIYIESEYGEGTTVKVLLPCEEKSEMES